MSGKVETKEKAHSYGAVEPGGSSMLEEEGGKRKELGKVGANGEQQNRDH